MASTYTTIQGDTWDVIALRVYGSESKADYLMQANLPLLDTFIFSAGETVNTPDLPTETDPELPAWRLAAYADPAAGDPYA